MRVALLLFTMLLAACSRSGQPDLSAYPAEAGLTRLCNNPALLGVEVDDLRSGGCGIDNPVSVSYAAGVRLNPPATLNCRTADTLANWVENDAQNAVKRLRSRIVEMTVLASYACRSRNGQPGARMSEHALGNAIDIGAFTLENGGELSVENDWSGRGSERQAVRALHASACGRFGTVLGPESDRYHYNHFHLDTAEYRSGSYCR